MLVSVARLVGIIRLTDAANLGELWNDIPDTQIRCYCGAVS